MCQTYTDGRDSEAICRRTLATMFAHFTQETGGHNPNGEVEEWRQGLVYLRYVSWPLIGQNVTILASDWSECDNTGL